MILVTGAAGKTGQAVVKALRAKGMETLAFVRNKAQRLVADKAGATQTLIGDIEEARDLAKAFQSAEKVYFIVPNVHPREFDIGNLAISIAREKGLGHFTYHSVLHPQIEKMPHHWRKLRVEEALIQSGLPFTILQPANYMQNVLAYWKDIVEKSVLELPYSVDALSSPVDLENVAEVASIVLQDDSHFGATYPLAGPENLSTADIARMIGKHLNREIVAKEKDLNEWQDSARLSGLDDNRLDTLTKMFAYYEKNDFAGNTFTLASLLQRRPTRFEEFLERELS